MPERIQMSRQRPWRADHPEAVRVDRNTKWGNPVRIVPVRKSGPFDLERDGIGFIGQNTDMEGARRSAASRYRDLVLHHPGLAPTADDIRRELAGKDLACWCPLDQPCHADVLLEIANPRPVCPECRDGKCRNCTDEALNTDDELVPCGCPNHEEAPCAS